MTLAPKSRTRSDRFESLEDYLRRRCPTCCQMEQAVIDIEELSPGVWGVELDDHSRVIAKHQALGSSTEGRPDDLLVVEAKILSMLVDRGCPVPRCIGTDAETRFIFLEHCGGNTLDDLAQEAGVPQGLSAKLISGFCRIEQALSELSEHLLPHVSTTDTDGPTNSRAHANNGLASILSSVSYKHLTLQTKA